MEAGTAELPAACARARVCSQLAGEGPRRSPVSTRACPGQRVQNWEAAHAAHVWRSRMRIARTRSICGERCQISSKGSSRTLPQVIGIATHGITSPYALMEQALWE